MQILFKNETTISKEKVYKIEKYAKIHKIKIIDILKFIICLMIILCTCILIKRGEKEVVIFIGLAIWGLRDTYNGINKKVKKGKIIYNFYENYFEVMSEDIILEVDYNVIKEIITEKEVYYIILEKSGLFIDRDSFIVGEKDEILNFLKERIIPEN